MKKTVKQNKLRKNKRSGMTLIEMAGVVALFGLALVVIVGGVVGVRGHLIKVGAHKRVKDLTTAAVVWYGQKGTYNGISITELENADILKGWTATNSGGGTTAVQAYDGGTLFQIDEPGLVTKVADFLVEKYTDKGATTKAGQETQPTGDGGNFSVILDGDV